MAIAVTYWLGFVMTWLFGTLWYRLEAEKVGGLANWDYDSPVKWTRYIRDAFIFALMWPLLVPWWLFKTLGWIASKIDRRNR